MTAQWSQLLYSLLVCFGGGTLVFLGISEATGTASTSRKAAAVAAALLLLVGGGAFFFSVGRPEAAVKVATNAVKGSPKSLEFVGTIVCLVVAVAYAVAAFRADAYEGDEDASSPATRVLGIVCLVCGVALPLLSGHAAALGRGAWAGAALPVAYLGNALAMGGALFTSIVAVRGGDVPTLRRYVLFAGIAAAIQAIAFVVLGVASGWSLDAGLFWGGAVAVGTAVPIAALALAGKARALVFAALAGTAAGGVCLRLAVSALGTTSLGLIANAASRTPLG